MAPKFKDLTYVRGQQQGSLQVTLPSDPDNHWPPTCSHQKESGKRYGSMFLFLVPTGTTVKHHSDTDTWDLIVSFPHSKTKERLVLWSGPMLGYGFAPEEDILGASDFTQKGFDWRGKDRYGKNWRWFSSIQDLVHYENVSGDAATFFDRIIDSVCVRRPD